MFPAYVSIFKIIACNFKTVQPFYYVLFENSDHFCSVLNKFQTTPVKLNLFGVSVLLKSQLKNYWNWKSKGKSPSENISAHFEALNAQLICQVPQSLFHAFQNAYVQIRHSFRMPSINPKDLQIFSLHVSNYFCSMLYIHSKKNYRTYIFPLLRSDF